MELPDRFVANITEVYGDEGRAWLGRLPAVLREAGERWDLQLGETFGELSYSYVVGATDADGRRLVLKARVPNSDFVREVAALRHYGGESAAALVAADEEAGLALLERVEPGTPLLDLGDDEQMTSIAAAMMPRLWKAPPPEHPFPDMRRWFQGMDDLRERSGGGTGPIPRGLFEDAERVRDELIASSGPPVVLHGDLHHWNILDAGAGRWVAIDPHGAVGEAEFECSALLRNPVGQLPGGQELRELERRRVAQLGEALGFERERIVGWGFVQAILSACWTLEGSETGWEEAVAVAEALGELL